LASTLLRSAEAEGQTGPGERPVPGKGQ
jgi:hypothetical protein